MTTYYGPPLRSAHPNDPDWHDAVRKLQFRWMAGKEPTTERRWFLCGIEPEKKPAMQRWAERITLGRIRT